MSAIRHHFLPQVYLRKFVSPKQKPLLWEFDKADGVFRESTPKRSGYEEHFYTVTDVHGRRDNETIEKKFHEIENSVPKLYEALRKEENSIPQETFINFVKFAATMFIRVPGYIEMVGAVETDKLRAEFERVRNDPEFIARAESAGVRRDALAHARVEADRNYVLTKAIRELHIPAIPFASMSWQFLKAPTDVHFLTGDHPVVHCNPNIEHAMFEIPLDDPAIEVTFPLSRTLCALGKWTEQQGWYRPVNSETVRSVNRRHLKASVRYIYSPTNDPQLWM